MAYGFRIGPELPRVEAALIEKFAQLPVACISDAMMRVTAGGARLRPIGKAILAGPALTVRTAPGDNLMVHKALDLAAAGDIIVVDAGGDLSNAIIGERMIEYAISRKLGGLVINGAIRDAAALRSAPIAVFAAGVTHRGPYKNGPGEINYPIAIDGMVIESGDIMLGDEDGLLCIPARDAAAVYPRALEKTEAERKTPVVGESRAWIDERLSRLGCEMPGNPPVRRIA